MQKVDLKKRVRESFEALPKAMRAYPVYLAVSAGLDSSVLASVALELRDSLPPLRFLHVNYRLRRPDCDREESLLRSWAAREGVPIDVLRLASRNKPENLQAWAREKRFGFFGRVLLKRSAGEGTVWLAHHRRDQAETVLLRLLRGAGLRGLAGMSPLEDLAGLKLFRPLLKVPVEALKLYARSHRVLFRQDRSNFTDLYLRNRIRRRLLPLMQRENPKVEETLAILAERAGQANGALENLADRWLERRGTKGEGLPLALLRREAPGLQSAILEAWLKKRNSQAQSLGKILPRLLGAIEGRKSLEIPLKGGRVRVSSRKLEYSGP